MNLVPHGYQKPINQNRNLTRRNPNLPSKPWSRPLSALVAQSTWEDPPQPHLIRTPKLLIVGGEMNFIPDWILYSHISIKHFNKTENITSSIGNFEPNAILIFIKATTGHTKHQTLDYGKQHNIPVLILSQGWGELIISAKAKGIAWLADIYPFKIWVPKEYYERRAKKKEQQTKKKEHPSKQRLSFIEKRKQIFASKGITHKEAKFAKTRYVQPGKSRCVLCDKSIDYQFSLDFNLPDEAIRFFPVGSTCIEEWISSLPSSDDKSLLQKQATSEIAKTQPRSKIKRKQKPIQTELFND